MKQKGRNDSPLPIASHRMRLGHISELLFSLAAAGVLLAVELEGHLLDSISLCFHVAELHLSLQRNAEENGSLSPAGMHFREGQQLEGRELFTSLYGLCRVGFNGVSWAYYRITL